MRGQAAGMREQGQPVLEPDAQVRRHHRERASLVQLPQQRSLPDAERCCRQLGIGGDNSHGGVGTFFEGAITAGFSSDATDKALQENIAAAGYARPSADP